MKIALINPPYKRNIIRRWYCSIESNNYLYPPLELIYIGGILKNKKNVKTILVDCIAEKTNKYKLIQKLKLFNPDYIIFMPGFQTINEDVSVMQEVKRETKCKLICFGYYPTLFSKEILEKYGVDIIIKGDPELIVSEIVNGKELINIDGISYKKNGKIKINKAKKELRNIDKLPYPDRSLLDSSLYSTSFPDKKPMTTLLTSRGCSHRCNYCISSIRDLRERKISNVINEIGECIDKFGIKTFRIVDESFTTNRKRVIEFCNLLIKKRYKIEWICLSRPDNLDNELLKKMRKAGCKRILVGIESGRDKILRYYNRHYNLDSLKYLFKKMKKIGITSLAFFLIGAPIESKEDIEKSIKFAKEIDPDFIFIDVLTPVPGTPLYDKLKKENKIKFSLIPYYVDYESLLSRKQLQKEMIRFHLSFYFNPYYLIRSCSWFFKNPKFLIITILNFFDWKKRKYVFGYT